jgi:hypothetical protein
VGYIVGFTKVFAMHQILILEFTCPLRTLSFIPPLLILGTDSTGTIFSFTYMSTHFFASYSPSYPLSLIPPPATGANTPLQDLILQFYRRKIRQK